MSRISDKNRSNMILTLVRDEMNFVRMMSLDEMDEYIESLLVRIISDLSDKELENRFNELMESEGGI